MNAAAAAGLLVLDKPVGMSSRAAVDRAAHWFPRGTKIGHAGTLDPLASGVLVVCLGAATRLIEYLQDMEKVYRTTLILGARSATDDAEGPILADGSGLVPTPESIDCALAGFRGPIEQRPPAYSAAKVAGRRAYDLARRGELVDLAPRTVTIHKLDVHRYAFPELELKVYCSKGTYIRSLARDLGERLGCGAYVATLQRLRIGDFDLADAVPLTASAESAGERVQPPIRALAGRPSVLVAPPDIQRLRNGMTIAGPALPEGPEFAAVDADGSLIAVVRRREADLLLQPVKVMPPLSP